MESGKHDFDGACTPGNDRVIHNQKTFSVGIFQWVPKNNGKGCKRSPVKVRLKGLFQKPEAVHAKAREICGLLDAGTYSGPKHVDVS